MSTRSTASWLPVADGSHFGLTALPYGSFCRRPSGRRELGVRIGDEILSLTVAVEMLDDKDLRPLFEAGTLDPLLGAGPQVWARVREQLTEWLTDDRHRPTIEQCLVSVADASMRLAFSIGDYVDFYASQHHAENLGRLFRPGTPPLPANWMHLPIGYHGRSGTIVVSNTPIVRPGGQRRLPGGEVTFGPCDRLDFEAELGFVVGVGSTLGQPVPLRRFSDHVFGVFLLNDWSARDIQAFEYVPLGPFLGKSFATSVSPWIVPLAALGEARMKPPPRETPLAAYLDDDGEPPWGLDIRFEVRLNGEVISSPPFGTTYWTGAQQMAHMTINGASMRTGDVFAAGTISGPEVDQRGSLIELAWNGAQPLRLRDGTTRSYLLDGDRVTISAQAPGPAGDSVGLGSVSGTISPWPISGPVA